MEIFQADSIEKYNRYFGFEPPPDFYLQSGKGATEGIPTMKYFADKICLSPNYFGDLVKSETANNASPLTNFT